MTLIPLISIIIMVHTLISPLQIMRITFPPLSNVADDAIDPLSKHFSDTPKFLVDLDATKKMKSLFQRVTYAKNFVSMI